MRDGLLEHGDSLHMSGTPRQTARGAGVGSESPDRIHQRAAQKLERLEKCGRERDLRSWLLLHAFESRFTGESGPLSLLAKARGAYRGAYDAHTL